MKLGVVIERDEDLSGNTSDVPCEKCHADVMDEVKVLAAQHRM